MVCINIRCTFKLFELYTASMLSQWKSTGNPVDVHDISHLFVPFSGFSHKNLKKPSNTHRTHLNGQPNLTLNIPPFGT